MDRVKCNEFRSGTCRVFATSQSRVVYCPRARAENAAPGECCHHPLYGLRDMLVEMSRGGVNLKRYGKRIKDPDFVHKLYSAFSRALSKRSAASDKTSGSS